jgi:5-methylcytosine-specific restriction endonuclease McrA
MSTNAAGRNVNGCANPNWKGGRILRTCQHCGSQFSVKPGRATARYCSLRCVGRTQRGVRRTSRAQVEKRCGVCSALFWLPRSHADRSECCSRACASSLRSARGSGAGNSNWRGGLSRMPYPWNFRFISRAVIARDGDACQNPECAGDDARLTAHHIDYDKQNCAPENLIALCSACNSKANFRRAAWHKTYSAIMAARADGRFS